MNGNRSCPYVYAEDVCSYCKVETEIVEDFESGDLVCTNCGLVLAERLVDFSAEWRSFSNDLGKKEDKSRAGRDPLNRKLGTSVVGGKTGDGSANLQRMNAALQGGVSNKKNKGIREDIERICCALVIADDVCRQAVDVAESLGNSSMIHGQSNHLVAAACIRLISNYNLIKLAKATGPGVKGGQIGALHKTIAKGMQKDGMPEKYGKPESAAVCVEDEIRKRNQEMEKQVNLLFNSMGGAEFKTRQLAAAVANGARMAGTVSCRHETLVAAAVLYAVTKSNKNAHPRDMVREVAPAADVHSDTIMKTYSILLQHEDGLLTHEDRVRFNDILRNLANPVLAA